MDAFIWLMFHLFPADNRQYFQWNDFRARSRMSSKGQILFVSLSLNTYISNLYIMDQNSRLPSHTICVMYLGYMSLLLVFGNFPLISKMGGYWNLLE